MRRILPDTVFLAASVTNVDYCEVNPGLAYAVNVIGTRHVVGAANQVGAKLVFFSSDYIFDGNSGPYAEDAPPCPISEYGRQKLIGEHLVALNVDDYLIVRTTVVYSWEPQAKNFVQRLIGTLRQGKQVTAPGDQIGTPTYAPNLAEAVLELSGQPVRGVINIAGPTLASRYAFAHCAATVFGLDQTLIQNVPTSLLKQAAARPLNAGLKADKAKQLLRTKLIGCEDGLRIMATELQGDS
jgi:dTDP-4-dehydrorhamnose reductase